jgi:trk system potassium uptake protein TrkH
MALNYSAIIKIISFIAILLGGAMVPSALVSLIYREYHTALVFAGIILPILAIGILVNLLIKVKISKMKVREGFFVVALTWLFASLIGTLPYLITGVVEGFPDAFFEAASGFTTTGASILTDIETLPKGLLFWRSFCQWLGGMGILVFAISILPALGISGQHMAKAETPGIFLSKVTPRMTDSAKILYIIYIFFTLIAILLFKLGGLNTYDAFIAAMGSVASGGLSNYSGGISYFNNGYIELIAATFTVLTCINFTLYYNIVKGKWKEFFGDLELRVFLIILIVAGVLISVNLWLSGGYGSFGESLRFGLFQSSAAATTTGHFSANFDSWPTFSKMLLFLLMLIGASSSSTGGGMKVIRISILVKLVRRGIFMRIHPNAVAPVKIQGRALPQEMLSGVMSFLSLYAFIFTLSTLVLSLENLDFLTTITAVAAALNNVGTGMGLVGPEGSFALFSGFSKIYLSFLMLMGRLELFTIILLFMPSYWNPDR